jgi:hypothetical protein
MTRAPPSPTASAKGESVQHKRDRGTEPVPFARVFEQLEPRT